MTRYLMAIYKIVSNRRVEIHGVLDGRRSLDDILMERILNSEIR